MSTKTSKRARNDHRRGSAYVMFLGVSMIVMVIGLSALLAARVQNRVATGTSDLTPARLYALSAIDMGFFLIRQAPTTWKGSFAAGFLPTKQPIGNGTFSLEATFIDDGDGDPLNDLMLMTGIGVAGRARYKLQVQLDANGSLVPGSWQQVVD
ncbi:MAG: hypothetical protein V3U29_04180 [Phycisphaeraceae bacterium]